MSCEIPYTYRFKSSFCPWLYLNKVSGTKKFGSELLTKVPAFAISVEGKWVKRLKIHVFGETAFWGPKI